MSRIFFHTEHEGTREVLGAERAHMGVICGDLASALIPRGLFDQADRLMTADARRKLLDVEAYRRADIAALYFRQDTMPMFQIDGEPCDNFDLLLNTVLAIGNNPLCLFARLHGQVELHAYVEGPHRSWLAGVIRDGLELGIYREGAGWDGVIELLEQANDAPVVTSYSITDPFPCDNTWDEAMAELRANVGIMPFEVDTLRTRFGDGKTLLDVLNQNRLKRAVLG
jgi:hypothetical protein